MTGIFLQDDLGNLFFAGSNAHGQSGLGAAERYTQFTQVSASSYNNEEISYVYSGVYSTAIVTTSGSIFVAGRNASNELALGDGDTTNRQSFTLMPQAQFGRKTISYIAMNGLNTFFIFTDGYWGVIGAARDAAAVGSTSDPIVPVMIVGDSGEGELNVDINRSFKNPYGEPGTILISLFGTRWNSYELTAWDQL